MDRLLRERELAIFSRLVRSRASAEPDRIALLFENGDLPVERVSYRDLHVRGNQLARALIRSGLIKGDRVGLMLRNHPEFLYAMVANSQLGLITVPIDPRARGERLRYFLAFASCSAVIAADYILADPQAAAVISNLGVRILALSTPEGRRQGIEVESWPSLHEIFAGPAGADVGENVDAPEYPWFFSYTSGTTGDPKAIVFGYDRMFFYRRTPDLFGYRDTDVPYTGLSLIHGNALVVTLMPALWGAVRQSVFSRWFTKTRLWRVCAEFGCTSWSNLGGIATAIYGEPPGPHDRAHQVRTVHSAGMPRALWRPFEERFGVRVHEWYGTMEGGFASNRPGVGPVGSFGKPPEGLLTMDVVDANDRPVAVGRIGELVVRPVDAPARLEYFGNPEASLRKTRGGWLHTGDMCWKDEEGWLFFAHRREEGGIRRFGEFVPEDVVRRVLAEDPEILDVHIYGVPAESKAPGECDVVAAIVVRDPQALDVPALVGRCRGRLERSHMPDYLQIVDELPKTATEKVQTRHLIEMFDPGSARTHRLSQVLSR